MVPFAGYEMPVQYSGIIEEHRAVRSRAGIFDVCHMTEFRVFGFGAFDFLQTTLTNDLSRISEVGQAQYSLMLNDDGGVIDCTFIFGSGVTFDYVVADGVIIRPEDNADADALADALDGEVRTISCELPDEG